MDVTDQPVSSLNRDDGNSLQDNYTLHDIGEAHFTQILTDHGFDVEPWGIDKRHDNDTLIYDDKMDLRVWDAKRDTSVTPHPPPSYSGEFFTMELYDDNTPIETLQWQLRALVDVKTKSVSSWDGWKGVFNLRHLVHYAAWADHYDVPAFVYFTAVDDEHGDVGGEEFVCPIYPWDGYEEYVNHYDRDSQTTIDTTSIADDCPYVSRTFGADDGNAVIVVDEQYRYSIERFFEVVDFYGSTPSNESYVADLEVL